MKERLISEADRLSDVAETNRQIEAYNDAVNAFNGGNHAAALAHLDRLLTFVSDPQVRESATALRARVRKRLGM